MVESYNFLNFFIAIWFMVFMGGRDGLFKKNYSIL